MMSQCSFFSPFPHLHKMEYIWYTWKPFNGLYDFQKGINYSRCVANFMLIMINESMNGCASVCANTLLPSHGSIAKYYTCIELHLLFSTSIHQFTIFFRLGVNFSYDWIFQHLLTSVWYSNECIFYVCTTTMWHWHTSIEYSTFEAEFGFFSSEIHEKSTILSISLHDVKYVFGKQVVSIFVQLSHSEVCCLLYLCIDDWAEVPN